MFCDCAGSRDDENVFGPGVDGRQRELKEFW
jgi:hypothetical protein